MAVPSREQPERHNLLIRRRRARTLTLPSWWRALAPGMPGKFWCQVEMRRREAGVDRMDTSAITYIVNELRSEDHGKHRRHH